ncbi:MAG: 2-hydroxychromene-2-carboxylate isomerase [Hyphomicrobium sp.]
MNQPKLEFWYEFASTYSYLSASRIAEAAALADIEIVWRPFPLGPIFKAQGWTDSPFNLYPAKGAYMLRDIARIAASRGRAFKMPERFPVNGLAAARLALAVGDDLIGPFSARVYAAQFEDGADIADPAVLAAVLTDLGLDPEITFATAETPEVKESYRENSQRAAKIGVFGAPSFVTEDGELFWGDDRLDQAIGWARKTAKPC